MVSLDNKELFMKHNLNQVWAKQQFEKLGKKKNIDMKELCDLLFTISCETKREETVTSEYDGIGYEKKTTVEYVPTERALKAYSILLKGFQK